MPLLTTMAFAPVLLKTGSATLLTCGPAAGGGAAVAGGGAAAAGGKFLGLAVLTKGVSSAAKSGAFTKVGGSAAAAQATVAPASTAAQVASAAPVTAAAPVIAAAPILATGPAGAPAVVAAPAAAQAAVGTGSAAMPATATGVVAAGEAAAAPAAGYGKHFTMIATVLGIMVLRALANRYWLSKPEATKNRLVRRVSRWSKEEEVAVEAEEEFGQIPQLPFKDERRSYVEAGTGAAAPTGSTGEGGSKVSTRATDAGLTDIETTASTQETRRRRVSYVRRGRGKLHRFL